MKYKIMKVLWAEMININFKPESTLIYNLFNYIYQNSYFAFWMKFEMKLVAYVAAVLRVHWLNNHSMK